MTPHYWIDAVLAGFGALICLIGLAMYLVQSWHRIKLGPSRYWPSVVGTITASAVQRSNAKGTATYTAAVRYRYQVGVGGKEYESDRIFWAPPEGPEPEIADIVAAYPVGRDVWVQYEPNNPANAVLEPARHTGLTPAVTYYGIALMVFGVAALGAGLYALSH